MKFLLLLSVIGLAFAAPTSVDREDVVAAGKCPADYDYPDVLNCSTECLTDSECDDGLKCCMTQNCGKKCLTPVSVKNDTTNATKEITEMLTTILEERQELIEKLEKYPPPPLRFIAKKNDTNVVRMCVATPCELRKCQRLASELTYGILPRKEHYCQLATSTEQCLFWVERGWSDVVVARDFDIFRAKTMFNVTAIAQEYVKNLPTIIEKVSQNISLAVTRPSTEISNLNHLAGVKICGAGINDTASFISPVATLIKKGIIPVTGNVLESAADFFGDMCVPGALNTTTFNINGTLPEKFRSICRGDEVSTVNDSFRCVKEHRDRVVFVDHKVVKDLLNTVDSDEYRLVCEDEVKPLSSWEDKSCHLGYTPRPVVFMNPERNDSYIRNVTEILTAAAKLNTGKPGSVDIFSSEEYVCMNGESKNLIFMDENTGFKFINESLPEEKVMNENYFKTYNVCDSLVSKPTVRFCVTEKKDYESCLNMKSVFDAKQKLRHIAWGCVIKPTNMDCMRAVLNGTAEIYSGNSKEVFIGGQDFMLQPIVMEDPVTRDPANLEDFVNKVFGTHSIAVALESKFRYKFGEETKFVNLRNLSVCSPGVDKVESFHLPVGRMLSSNIIPRIGSVFESVDRFFKSACIPGVNPVSYKHDLDIVLGHEVNWGIPGLSFYNFTGYNWFIWNSPHTWNFYNYNRKTPGTLEKFMKNRLLVPILDGKLSLPEGFDVENFDYSILEDVLSVEGLGDILSDIPEKIRDRLVNLRVSNKEKMSTFKDLYEERTGSEFVLPKDKRLSKQTLRSYLQQSFDNMEDEWGIFERSEEKSMTGSKITNVRSFIDERVDEQDPNSIISNLLKDYDSEYTVPLISKVFAEVLERRFDTLYGLAESLNTLHRVPTMSSIRDEQYKWIKHPAVQAFVRIYAPRLITYQRDLYTNTELDSLVHSRYLNPLWLSPTYSEFLDTMKTHMTSLVQDCQGYGDLKGALSSQEAFYGFEGSMECISSTKRGDVAFVQLEEFMKSVEAETRVLSDYVVITPLGLVKDVTKEMLRNVTFLKNVTFGVNAYPALLTSFNQTGTWRWNVTKALLEAQKIFSTNQNDESTFTLFGVDSVFAPGTKRLMPIPIQDQNFATYLGPNLTRSFEAIIKPSTFDWWKENRHICTGESYTNVIEQRNGTCKAIVKDVTCSGMPRPKVVSLGLTDNKIPTVVRMCSRPSSFVREMAEFVCDNGHGYVSPVMVPTTCSCMPCEDIEYVPEWTKDPIWNKTTVKHTVTENSETSMHLWGNEEFWLDHDLNTNFKIGEEKNMTANSTLIGDLHVRDLETCEANWYGFNWHKEWFPETSRPICKCPTTGLRRFLTSERIKTKRMP